MERWEIQRTCFKLKGFCKSLFSPWCDVNLVLFLYPSSTLTEQYAELASMLKLGAPLLGSPNTYPLARQGRRPCRSWCLAFCTLFRTVVNHPFSGQIRSVTSIFNVQGLLLSSAGALIEFHFLEFLCFWFDAVRGWVDRVLSGTVSSMQCLASSIWPKRPSQISKTFAKRVQIFQTFFSVLCNNIEVALALESNLISSTFSMSLRLIIWNSLNSLFCTVLRRCRKQTYHPPPSLGRRCLRLCLAGKWHLDGRFRHCLEFPVPCCQFSWEACFAYSCQ